ncbi:hypothetical protein MMC08_004607 [Hypocenomyce scalaris]|nr:hypothetical protein [Hypocenomyce scalaris]
MSVHEYDVVVVGGGNTALVAALSAHESGVRVVMIEAAPKAERGGNSRFSGTAFRFPHRGMVDLKPLLCDDALADAKRCRVAPYSAEEFARDMIEKSRGKADRTETDVIVRKSYETVEWMRDHGVHWEMSLKTLFNNEIAQSGITDIPPGYAVQVKNLGVGLTDDLWETAEKTNITVFYDCPAHDLITEGDRVLGVRARRLEGYHDFYGQVILGCGGFEANPRMRRQYLGEGTDLINVRGTRFNTGTMLGRALAAGAQASGHWGGYHSSPQDVKSPRMGDLNLLDNMSRYSFSYCIMVNLKGQRFVDEGENEFSLVYATMGAEIAKQPEAKAFQIFDQKTIHLLEPRYKRTGTPIVSDTFSGLAKQMGISPSAFSKTIKEFNAATKPGKFDPFHNDSLCTADGLMPRKSNWALPIDQAPYVAYAVTNGITFTFGGIKADANARVLNNEGRPMPGLWATGEITGGFHHGYCTGASLMRASVLARIAGQSAAERSRKPKLVSRM